MLLQLCPNLGCVLRTCSMKGLYEKVNGAIDDISVSLTTLLDVIETTDATIRTTLDSITYVPPLAYRQGRRVHWCIRV